MDFRSLKELVAIDSPTGFTKKAAQYIFDELKSYGCSPEMTHKGAVKCALGEQPVLGIAAHVDTLGGIVSKISADGTLRISKIGGPSLNAYEGSYCRVYTLDDKTYTATFLFDNPSVHVNAKLGKEQRTIENMHIRLDEVVKNETDVEKLGISIGDFVCFETHYQELPSGFIKSKFMDNKAGCFVLFEIARRVKESGKSVPVELFFSNYEEVGHGGTTGYGTHIKDLLTIDMGVIGNEHSGLETHCSICAKDGGGPYDYDLRKELVLLARKNNIQHKQDVYRFYSSDGTAAWRAGNDFRVALIGPGVSASHGVERTHKDGIEATIELCMAYINEHF